MKNCAEIPTYVSTPVDATDHRLDPAGLRTVNRSRIVLRVILSSLLFTLPIAAHSGAQTPDKSWSSALEAFRRRVQQYDFDAAYNTAVSLRTTDPSLQQKINVMTATAKQLVDWKRQIITDLNRSHYDQRIEAVTGAKYLGITGATPDRLRVKMPFGEAEIPWPLLRPETILQIAASLAKADPATAAKREMQNQFVKAELADPTRVVDGVQLHGKVVRKVPEGVILTATISKEFEVSGEEWNGDLLLIRYPQQKQLAESDSIVPVKAVRVQNYFGGGRELRAYEFVDFVR